MRYLKSFLVLSIFISLSSGITAAPISASATPISSEQTVRSAEEMLRQFDREVMEEKLGRKLRFGERIVLKMMQKRLSKKSKKKDKKQESGLGIASIVVSSLGLFMLLFFVFGSLFGLLAIVALAWLFPILLLGGILLSIVGLILGIIGLAKNGDRFSKIGFGLGLGGLGFVLLSIIVYLAVLILI